jgi:murein L,D-transpeptidase YcbB/YkuD
MIGIRGLRGGLLLGLVLLPAVSAAVVPVQAATDNGVAAAIQARVESLRANLPLTIDGARLAATRFVPAFYENRRFHPAWTNQSDVDALLAAVYASAEHGLDPADAHAEPLRRLGERIHGGEGVGPDTRADFDILLTDSFARLGFQLYFGKLDSERLVARADFARPLLDEDPLSLTETAVQNGRVGETLARLELDHPDYRRMQKALSRLREAKAAGGWPSVPAGPTLQPGTGDPRVAALRKRLRASGEYAAAGKSGKPTIFDPALVEAVKSFQKSHGLEADGVVGTATLAAMNVPVEQRIAQIRVNMERARWFLRGLDGEFVVVNIAGFRASLIRQGRTAWETRAVVGKPYRETPEFRADMTYLVFNPTWTVPPTIFREDMLPKARRDPSFFATKGLRVIARGGDAVDPESVDWHRVSGRNPRYQLVQPAGPENPLGVIKFMLPNKYSIYLHDTPQKELFRRTERTFSSGCIRIEDPRGLAELVLGGNGAWTRDRIAGAIAAGRTRTVFLPSPLPVLLLYRTVEFGEDGAIRFLNDIYGRDARILKALEEPIRPET